MTAPLSLTESVALTFAAVLAGLALVLALQPLWWSPAPAAETVYAAHGAP